MRRSIVGMAVLSIAALSPNLAQADRRADQEIANKVQQGLLDLKDRGDLRGFSIDLEVDDATVWLKGHVSTAEQETKALEMARYIPGVKQVVDDLRVATAAPTPATPAANETVVEAEAPQEPARMPNMLGSLKKLTGAFAKKDENVKPANDQSAGASNDSAIAKTIIGQLQSLKDAGELRGFNLDLEVNGGDVVLKGHVRDQQQHDKVIEIARRVEGVRQVVDGVRVSSPIVAATPTVAVPTADAQVTPVQATAEARPLQPTPAGPQSVSAQEAYAQYAQAYARYAQAYAQARQVNYNNTPATPMPMAAGGPMVAPARFDHPQLPGYSWPSYAAHPNYAAVTYPKQYSPAAWPYIGPFYPYPQVPLGWRKVTLQWDDGWWFLDFKDK